MWKTVPVRESNLKNRPGSFSRRRRDKPSTSTSGEAEAAESTANAATRENEVNRIVKQVRRVANALRQERWVIDTMALVEAAVFDAALRAWSLPSAVIAQRDNSVRPSTEADNSVAVSSSTVVEVCVVALGIGSIVDHEGSGSICASSLLQLGLLHCVFDEQLIARVERKLKNLIPISSTLPREPSAHLDETAIAPSSASSLALRIEYFDPVLTGMDNAVCAKLGYAVGVVNHYGGYTVDSCSGSPRVLVAYMPHASATLYHNLFAANWPSLCGPEKLVVCPLERLVVIGNNLNSYDSRNTTPLSFTRLMPALRVSELFRADSRSRKLDRGIEGIAFMDVERAFSDMCLTTTATPLSPAKPQQAAKSDDASGANNKSTLELFLMQLVAEKIPKIVRDGADTL
jgi:hypothetical protein